MSVIADTILEKQAAGKLDFLKGVGSKLWRVLKSPAALAGERKNLGAGLEALGTQGDTEMLQKVLGESGYKRWLSRYGLKEGDDVAAAMSARGHDAAIIPAGWRDLWRNRQIMNPQVLRDVERLGLGTAGAGGMFGAGWLGHHRGFNQGESEGLTTGLNKGLDTGAMMGYQSAMNQAGHSGILQRLASLFTGSPAGMDPNRFATALDQNRDKILQALRESIEKQSSVKEASEEQRAEIDAELEKAASEMALEDMQAAMTERALHYLFTGE